MTHQVDRLPAQRSRAAASVSASARRRLHRARTIYDGTLQFRMTHQPRASFKSPRFAQPATFMRLPHVEDPRGLDVAIVGVPFDGGTSYRPGARLGPREIRAQSSLIRPYSYFQKVAPFDRLNVADVGDIDAPPVSIEKCYDAVEARIGAIADGGARPIVDRRRSLDLAADPARAGQAPRPARARAVRRAHRHVGRVFRRQVLSRHAVPPRDRRRASSTASGSSRSASADRCTARTTSIFTASTASR